MSITQRLVDQMVYEMNVKLGWDHFAKAFICISMYLTLTIATTGSVEFRDSLLENSLSNSYKPGCLLLPVVNEHTFSIATQLSTI